MLSIDQSSHQAESALHTPALDALSANAETLTLRFASRHEGTIQCSDLEALTWYLIDHAHVKPLPKADESVFDGFQTRRVDL